MENTHSDTEGEEIEIPFILHGLHTPYTSRLVFPPGMETVTDEAFRQFGEEMREQYEVLEADFNNAKRDAQILKAELIRQKNKNRLIEESYKQLLKKVLKITSRDYPQFKFGEVILDDKFNCILPCYNDNTRRFTNYSNLTRSFLDIVKSQDRTQE